MHFARNKHNRQVPVNVNATLTPQPTHLHVECDLLSTVIARVRKFAMRLSHTPTELGLKVHTGCSALALIAQIIHTTTTGGSSAQSASAELCTCRACQLDHSAWEPADSQSFGYTESQIDLTASTWRFAPIMCQQLARAQLSAVANWKRKSATSLAPSGVRR